MNAAATTTGTPVVHIDNVVAGYLPGVNILNGCSLQARQGELIGIIGPNGAGKSTLLKVISGQMEQTSGDIHLAGVHVTGAKPDDLARVGLTTVPEGRSVFPNLTVEENLLLMSYAGVPADKVFDTAYTYFPRLHERRYQLAGTMSGGEQQMLAMGRALMAQPKVLLLDEPSMGLSPIMVDKIFEVVKNVYDQGVTVLLVEQNASRALQIADRGYVMESGLITMTGDAKIMLNDPKVRAAYLGE